MAKKIVLTGGGTAGHVTPNIALVPKLRELGYEIYYIGSYEGIEKKLISDFDIPYYGIATGKFRRYFDPKNFTDPFRVMKGYREARKYLKQTGYRFFQRRFCQRSRRSGRRFPVHSLHYPRVGYDAGTGQQAVHTRSGKNMLQFPGNHSYAP